ncbi:UNVERIFIED_CONTAM: Transposon Tf2-12 polyprotein [Sesamum radiatum]|uniref:RNA-directed DNA polymerase n=1 Tax=Sesamum radiatum TaxID=300843 RepID=A0AAW2ILF2_SESRA
MPGQEPKSPRRAASPSERAAIPEDENSQLQETVMNLEEKVSSMESEITMLSSELEDRRHVIRELTSAFDGGGVADIRREMEQMSIQIGLLQCAVSNGPAVAHDTGARLWIPEPKAYNGARDAKEAEHTGSVRDYVKSFSVLMLDIRDMSEKDKLFTFMEGLRSRARLELQRQRVTDLGSAMAAAERLIDFVSETQKDMQTTTNPVQNKTGGAKSFRSNSNRGGGDRKPYSQTSSQGSSNKNKPQENKQGAPQKSSGCFLCDSPHRYRDCPKKQLLNALATFGDKVSPAKPVEPQVVAKKQCHPGGKTAPALIGNHPEEEEAQPRNPQKKGLMFVDVKIDGKPIHAMIDTGATHNYLASAKVERLGLVLEKGVGRVKAIKSAAQPIAGVAKSVLIKVGPFEGKTNLSVMVMDDFKLILRLEFLRDTRTAVFPHVDSLMIMGTKPCVIPTLVGRTREKNLSAMQFEKWCKWSEPSYLCALHFDEIEEASGPIPGVVKRLLKEFEDVMPIELPRKLPPKRAVDHEIELVPGTKPSARAPYRMLQPELVELRKQLKEMLESRIIKPAKSLYGASALFQKNADDSLRMCCDYRALDKITVKNKYPRPLVADCFDRLSRAKYFTKIDLRSGYWHVRIKEGDEAKTTVVTRYGAFEFLVLSFGLTNAPATFSTLMNQVLHGFLDEFVVVYLDDIVIYSGTLAEHVEHLWQVLTRLREHELYAKRFVKGYSGIARPMTDLLKKMETWNWTPQCQVSFDNLKRAMVTDPVLVLPNMSKPFVVETNASDFALGVLMQDGHPVAFEMKLKDVERRYSVHEKELLAVVHYLRLWRHYLLDSPFMVKTDNTAVSHFMTQPKLTSRQARWQKLLSEFHFVLEYRAGSSNHVADALSRRADLASLGSVAAFGSSAVATSIRHRARELLHRDSTAQGLVHLVEKGKARQFWLEDALLMTKGNRLYVPKGGDLRNLLISECYDTLWAGHQGEERTYALVHRAYYWPQMRDDVETYVRTCLICQQDKADHQRRLVDDLGSIIVVVDRLSKYATFIAAAKHVTAEGTTHLFFKHIVKYWGLPKDMASDRDSRFTGVRSPLARSFSQEWKQNVDIVRSCLEKAQKWMKKYADQNRRFIEFNAGDIVMVKVLDLRLSKSSRGRDPRLMQKYVGPLPVIKHIGTVP